MPFARRADQYVASFNPSKGVSARVPGRKMSSKEKEAPTYHIVQLGLELSQASEAVLRQLSYPSIKKFETSVIDSCAYRDFLAAIISPRVHELQKRCVRVFVLSGHRNQTCSSRKAKPQCPARRRNRTFIRPVGILAVFRKNTTLCGSSWLVLAIT